MSYCFYISKPDGKSPSYSSQSLNVYPTHKIRMKTMQASYTIQHHTNQVPELRNHELPSHGEPAAPGSCDSRPIVLSHRVDAHCV